MVFNADHWIDYDGEEFDGKFCRVPVFVLAVVTVDVVVSVGWEDAPADLACDYPLISCQMNGYYFFVRLDWVGNKVQLEWY